MVVLWGSRAGDGGLPLRYQGLQRSRLIHVLYLDELDDRDSFGISIVNLVVGNTDNLPARVTGLLRKAIEIAARSLQSEIIERVRVTPRGTGQAMQGTLDEIDTRSLLQLLELGQQTGELYIEAGPDASPRSWCLFFVNGQIAYAVEQTSHPLARLQDYLYADRLEIAADSPNLDRAEYDSLWQLLSEKQLTPPRARAILQAMILEILFDLFSLRQGSFLFERGVAIVPQLFTLAISPILPKLARQAQQWQRFYPQIKQADQFLTIPHTQPLQAALPETAYENLLQWASQKTTIRQISRYLQRDLVIIARHLYPYAQRGWLRVVSPPRDPKLVAVPRRERTPHLVSIEEDRGIGETIERSLAGQNYRYTRFRHPLEALSQLFGIEPDLIFCHIVLPTIDGYELCAMLRHCRGFRSIPIILLTGQGTGIDRIKAKLVGATDTLDLPFGQPELSRLLAEYT